MTTPFLTPFQVQKILEDNPMGLRASGIYFYMDGIQGETKVENMFPVAEERDGTVWFPEGDVDNPITETTKWVSVLDRSII